MSRGYVKLNTYCAKQQLELTRSRAYRKNDQAWVEQKNGSVVRRLVGYGRLSGLHATRVLASLYAAARLYVNYFQPSLKLKTKSRTGAQVSKTYHPPSTPCERLLGSLEVGGALKTTLKARSDALDPVQLLRDIREAQQELSALPAHAPEEISEKAPSPMYLGTFLASLRTAWKEGEVRPTHRPAARAERWWQTRVHPFADAWPVIESWLQREPTLTAKALTDRLAQRVPELPLRSPLHSTPPSAIVRTSNVGVHFLGRSPIRSAPCCR
jgi:hypothetical protein